MEVTWVQACIAVQLLAAFIQVVLGFLWYMGGNKRMMDYADYIEAR